MHNFTYSSLLKSNQETFKQLMADYRYSVSYQALDVSFRADLPEEKDNLGKENQLSLGEIVVPSHPDNSNTNDIILQKTFRLLIARIQRRFYVTLPPDEEQRAASKGGYQYPVLSRLSGSEVLYYGRLVRIIFYSEQEKQELLSALNDVLEKDLLNCSRPFGYYSSPEKPRIFYRYFPLPALKQEDDEVETLSQRFKRESWNKVKEVANEVYNKVPPPQNEVTELKSEEIVSSSAASSLKKVLVSNSFELSDGDKLFMSNLASLIANNLHNPQFLTSIRSEDVNPPLSDQSPTLEILRATWPSNILLTNVDDRLLKITKHMTSLKKRWCLFSCGAAELMQALATEKAFLHKIIDDTKSYPALLTARAFQDAMTTGEMIQEKFANYQLLHAVCYLRGLQIYFEANRKLHPIYLQLENNCQSWLKDLCGKNEIYALQDYVNQDLKHDYVKTILDAHFTPVLETPTLQTRLLPTLSPSH